ncbi:hypothetical protein ACLOJK_015309 [Asimina triloba]
MYSYRQRTSKRQQLTPFKCAGAQSGCPIGWAHVVLALLPLPLHGIHLLYVSLRSPITAPPSLPPSLRRCLPLPRHSAAASLSTTVSLIAASLVSPTVSLAVAAASSPSLALAAVSSLSLALAAFPFSLPIPTVPVHDSLSLALFPPSSASLSLPSFFSGRCPLLYPASAARFLSSLLQQLIFDLFVSSKVLQRRAPARKRRYVDRVEV